MWMYMVSVYGRETATPTDPLPIYVGCILNIIGVYDMEGEEGIYTSDI